MNYLAVRSWIKAPPEYFSWALYSNWFYQNCQNNSNIEHNDSFCILAAKNAETWVPIRELEEALITAFELRNINIRNRNVQKYVNVMDKNQLQENDPYRKDNFNSLSGTEEFLPWCYSEGCY